MKTMSQLIAQDGALLAARRAIVAYGLATDGDADRVVPYENGVELARRALGIGAVFSLLTIVLQSEGRTFSGGADFAALAKEFSEDPGSKEKGGLYEDVSEGGGFDKSFEAAG
mgnify:CR=1 FL=1